MSLTNIRNDLFKKDIDKILENEELTTMQKAKEIMEDNYFTNFHRAKGIFALIEQNTTEINNNSFLASYIANKIQQNCLIDFQKVAERQKDNFILPDKIKNAIEEHIKNEDNFER